MSRRACRESDSRAWGIRMIHSRMILDVKHTPIHIARSRSRQDASTARVGCIPIEFGAETEHPSVQLIACTL